MGIINGAGVSCVVPSQPVNDEAALKPVFKIFAVM